VCEAWHVSDPAALPSWEGQAERVYANAMNIGGGAFDVVLIFGQQHPPPGGSDQEPKIEEVVRVCMSWGHAKSMIPLLARMVADYESKFGNVPAPGFDDNWRG